jgi:hypothetical protein
MVQEEVLLVVTLGECLLEEDCCIAFEKLKVKL